jgi:hypothetical protein
VKSVFSSARREAEVYRHGEDRPLEGYVQLAGIYAASTAAIAGLARVRKQPAQAMTPFDVALLTLATQKVARLVAKDPVTSPLRAPFTRYEGLSAPGELAEEVRGHGLRHSFGELLTCPMCLAQWVATGFTLGFAISPTTARLVMAAMAAVGGADFLQHAYVLMQKASEK